MPRPAVAAPEARLIDGPWTRFGTGGDPDTADWAAFLNRYRVPGQPARLRYSAAVADGSRLTRQIGTLSQVVPERLSRPAAMAFWINLYNILTVDLVLSEWPVSSIREVRGGLFNLGPWDEEVVTVAGHRLTLDDIEHGILRPIWRDARIHYAVNCAALGCPELAAEPYAAETLDTRLDRQARAYVNSPHGVRETQDGLVLSRLFDWYATDWGDEAALRAHLAGHAETETRRALLHGAPIAGYRYDWDLNAA